jgi:hypothetical protein
MSALGAYGTDVAVFFGGSRVGIGTASTIIAGHLAVQVFACRVYPDDRDRNIADPEPKMGNWGSLLAQIRPIQRESIVWPPPATFTIRGAHSIATLMDRWRIGTAVPHATSLKRGRHPLLQACRARRSVEY